MRSALTLLLAVMIPAAFTVGNITALKEAECTMTHPEDGHVTSEKPYDLIIYDGEPFVEVITEHRYMHILEDGTLVITDKDIDEVINEMKNAEDLRKLKVEGGVEGEDSVV